MRFQILSCFSAVLLLSSHALAGPLKDPKYEIGPFAFSGGGCTLEDQKHIKTTFSNILYVIHKVLDPRDMVEYERASWKTYMNFKNEPITTRRDPPYIWVRSVFEKMRDLLKTGGMRVNCVQDRKCESLGSWIQRGSVGSQNVINICPTFLQAPEIPFEKIFCSQNTGPFYPSRTDSIDGVQLMPEYTVLKMFARFALYRESDCYDGPFAAEFLARAEPEISLENPSSYAWYAMAEHINTVCPYRKDTVWRTLEDHWDFKGQMQEFQKKQNIRTEAERAMGNAGNAYSTELEAFKREKELRGGDKDFNNPERTQRIEDLYQAFANAKDAYVKSFKIFKAEDIFCQMKNTKGWREIQVEMTNRWRDHGSF